MRCAQGEGCRAGARRAKADCPGGTEAPRLALVLQPCGVGMVAGRLRGAPPSETGPTGLGCRAIFLRTTRDSRLPACLAEMEEVTSGAIAFCSESTFAIRVEIFAEIFFTSSCSSAI